MPQVGHVIVQDDVEIGANVTIDRGALGPTIIGKGTKIDNLVQIAHNVCLGEHCLLVAQVGVAGSTKIGSHATLAGQAGITGHLKIGNNAIVAAQSGVMNDIPDGGKWMGSPAQPNQPDKRQLIALHHLPELIRRVNELEKRLGPRRRPNPRRKFESGPIRPMARATGGAFPPARTRLPASPGTPAAKRLAPPAPPPRGPPHPRRPAGARAASRLLESGAGPDFRGAVLQFGQDEPRSGDVEIDCGPAKLAGAPSRGQSRLRQRDLARRLDGRARASCAAARPGAGTVLDMPLAEMPHWAGGRRRANAGPNRCAAPAPRRWANWTPEQTDDLLRQAALVRFERKARELESRARQAGWEQALWEGIFRALGYKQNVWPMQRVGELLPLLARRRRFPARRLQARLLGVGRIPAAGLPAASQPGDYLARLVGPLVARPGQIPRRAPAQKSLAHARPASGQPAAAPPGPGGALAGGGGFPGPARTWFTAAQPDVSLPASLLACLQPAADDFWSWHWGFASARLRAPQPLLGESRAADLAVNIILPWFWTRARAGKKRGAGRRPAEKHYLAWPAAQDNSLLRLARRRLLGARGTSRMKTAAGQQGLLQIIHDFCDHTNSLCADCAFPDLVRTLWEVDKVMEPCPEGRVCGFPNNFKIC